MRDAMHVLLGEWDARLAHTPSGSRAHLLEAVPRSLSAINPRRARW
jgi:hypothetical protein